MDEYRQTDGPQPQKSTILELRDVKKTFVTQHEKTEVLNGLNLEVGEGEFITLLGSSGCGKTTTLRIIAGLETPTSGRVFLKGKDITDLPPEKRDVNTVFQSYALFPNMNVAENIGYGLRIRHVKKGEIAKKVAEMLELVQLPEYGGRYPNELSGGQRQRVAIARAIINEPKVLLLDEPLGALDLKLRRQMQLELKRLQKKTGITFIYITHDQEEAINMSDRIAVMHNGDFEQLGTPNEIYYHPRTTYVANFIGSANLYRESGKTWAIRQENLLFAANAEAAAHSLNAAVTEKSFAGGQLRIMFTLDGGQTMTASRSGIDSTLKVGDSVKIGWTEESQVGVEDNGI